MGAAGECGATTAGVNSTSDCSAGAGGGLGAAAEGDATVAGADSSWQPIRPVRSWDTHPPAVV